MRALPALHCARLPPALQLQVLHNLFLLGREGLVLDRALRAEGLDGRQGRVLGVDGFVAIAKEYPLLHHLDVLRGFLVGEEVAGGEQLAQLNLAAPEHVLIVGLPVDEGRLFEKGNLVLLVLLDYAVLEVQADVVLHLLVLLLLAAVRLFVYELLGDCLQRGPDLVVLLDVVVDEHVLERNLRVVHLNLKQDGLFGSVEVVLDADGEALAVLAEVRAELVDDDVLALELGPQLALEPCFEDLQLAFPRFVLGDGHAALAVAVGALQLLEGVGDEGSEVDGAVVGLDDDHEGQQVAVLAEAVDVPFRDPDVRVPEEGLRVEVGGEVEVILVELQLALDQDHAVLERAVKLVDELGPFLVLLPPDQPAAGGLRPRALLPAVEARERHHLLYLVGVEVVAELLEVCVFDEGGGVHLVEEEGDHDDLVVLLLEEVALEVALRPVLLQHLLLHVVVPVDEALDLDDALLVAHVVLVVAGVELLLVGLVLELEVGREAVPALRLGQVVGLLHELVEVEPAVLLELGQQVGLAEDVGQLEHDRAEEGDLADDDIDLLHRLRRQDLRHYQLLRDEVLVLLLEPDRIDFLAGALYLRLEHLHHVLEDLLDLHAPLKVPDDVLAQLHDGLVLQLLGALGDGLLHDGGVGIFALLLDDGLVVDLVVAAAVLPDVEQQLLVLADDVQLHLVVLPDGHLDLRDVGLVLVLAPDDLLQPLLQPQLLHRQLLVALGVGLERVVLQHVLLVVVEVLALLAEGLLLGIEDVDDGQVLLVEVVALEQLVPEDLEALLGDFVGLGGEGDVIGAELVIDGEVEEVDVLDEVEDDEGVVRAVLATHDLALVLLQRLRHVTAQILVDAVHVRHQLLQVLHVVEQLAVVLVDLQAVALLLHQDLRHLDLVYHPIRSFITSFKCGKHHAQIFSMIVFSSRQLFRPSSPSSRPMPESLNPPKGAIEAKVLQQFTQTVPTRSFLTRQLTYEWLSVTTPAPSPQAELLARWMTSSRSSNLKTLLTGPKISSLAMVWLSCTSAKTVGSTYHPLLPHRLPPEISLAPSFLPCSMQESTLFICSSLTSGPCSVSAASE